MRKLKGGETSMCGIAGYIGDKGALLEKAQRMSDALVLRGPDDEGLWQDEAAGLVLAFRRLAIQDLSSHGAQPMVSQSGRYLIVFNGEIYNFLSIKKDLQLLGAFFKGGSDTEVILAAVETWGFETTLKKINGMFALALYDRHTRQISFARDPLGKKPLYIGWGRNGLYFASEMKAILAALPEKPNINKRAASLFLQWRYVPDPHCIYEGFWKLPPGHSLKLDIANLKNGCDLEPFFTPFWQMPEVLEEAKRKPFLGNYEAALDRLEEILTAATARRMIADVPLGAFLSGGIDSSLIVALMRKQTDTVNSFTIAFDDPRYNEAEQARAVAAHLGAQHHEEVLKPEVAKLTVEVLPDIFDEPFADPSALPSYQVCKLARKTMTVALSGDGGDESFGGYGWYKRAAYIRKHAAPIRKLGGFLCEASTNPQLQKLGRILRAKDAASQYAALHSYRPLIVGLEKDETVLKNADHFFASNFEHISLSPHEKLMAYDSVMFLPGDVLTKVDRTSMAASLEVRSPLLDKDVLEFAWSLPAEMRMGKKLLKDLLRRYLPGHMIDRPKQGFSIPHQKWLREDLSGWAEELLSVDKTGMLEQGQVQALWQAHKSGRADYGHILWTLVQFQVWARRWL